MATNLKYVRICTVQLLPYQHVGTVCRYMCNLCTTTILLKLAEVFGVFFSRFSISGIQHGLLLSSIFIVYLRTEICNYVARSRCSTVLRHLEVGSFDVAGSRKLVRLVFLDDMASTANLSFPAASKTTVGRSRTPRLEKRRKCSRCCVWRRRDARA